MLRCAFVVALFLGLAAQAVGAPSETKVRARRGCVTAIALRDRVPAEQMLGTMAFTRPLLAASYAKHVYIEAPPHDDDEARDRGRSVLVDALAAARAEECVVDLFFLAHGDDFASWVEDMNEDERPRLRLVYDTGAGDLRQGQRWLDVGARSFVGHPGGNVAPVFFAFFLPGWIGGDALAAIVGESNASTFVVIDATRPFVGEDEAASLWRGTRAQIVGDASLRKR